MYGFGGCCVWNDVIIASVLQHTESIVKEIEDALRKEIIAASTLPERPPSPNNYARQRTMVVMETVRAATLASARKLEQIARNDGSSHHEGGIIIVKNNYV